MITAYEIFNRPDFRILLSTGLGAVIGGAYGSTTKDYPLNTQEERTKRTLAMGLRGGLMGAGVGTLANLAIMNSVV